MSESAYKIMANLIKSLLDQSNDGVPIGTDLSHFLAHIYLHDFDVKLIKKFDKKYFRYVDDIIILGHESEIESIKTIVKNSLPNGLSINQSKTDQKTSYEWNEIHSSYDDKDNFYNALKSLTGYLAMYPEKMDALKNKLKEKSINVPLIKIHNQSKSKGWRYFLRSSNVIKYLRLSRVNADHLIFEFSNIKKQYLNDADKLLANTEFTDENDASNRTKVQKLRSIVGQLFYLLPPQELEKLGERLPDINKIADLKAVINAITKKDLITACKYCGKVIQTICEIWVEADLNIILLSKQDFIQLDRINEVIDSILIMRLYGIIDFDFMELSPLLSEKNQKYCAVVLGYSVNLTEDEKKLAIFLSLMAYLKVKHWKKNENI